MPTVRTLRDGAGIGHEPAPLAQSALVIIDCQNIYREGVMQLVGFEPALAEVARLLARARATRIPVFHIMHDAGPGTPYDIRAEIGQISHSLPQRRG